MIDEKLIKLAVDGYHGRLGNEYSVADSQEVLRQALIEANNLWENDLKNEPYLCELLIEQYYYNDGRLPNYSSFNYHIEDGHLALNREIVYPYFLIEETKEAG